MPTAIEDCITTVLGKLIKSFVSTSVSKTFNMSGRKGLTNYYSLYEIPPVRNGLKYDNEIDVAIVEELICSREISSANLRRIVEKCLCRTIKDKTYYNHLRRLQKENIIFKRDIGRGKEVYYSLTGEAKERAKLRLLRTYPEFDSLKKIYINLLLRAITEPELLVYSNVDRLLLDMHVTRKDLRIDHIEKEHSDMRQHAKFLNKPERMLPIGLVLKYKPIIEGVQVTETITYRENTQTHHILEDESLYYLSIPGVTSNGFANTFLTFKPKAEDVEKAFDLLLKSNLIIRKELRNEIRYTLADEALQELIADIKMLDKIEREENYIKLTYYNRPSNEEIDKRRVLYTDERLFIKFYNKKEEQQYEFRKLLQEKMDKKELQQLSKKLERTINLIDRNKNILLDHIREKHGKTLEKYAFLHDIIGIRYPSLFNKYQSP